MTISGNGLEVYKAFTGDHPHCEVDHKCHARDLQ